jgi:spoIIIJ-associated protein
VTVDIASTTPGYDPHHDFYDGEPTTMTTESATAEEPTTESVELVDTIDTIDTAPTVSQLEEEGEIAADYIEELLDITDLDGDIEIDTRGGRAYVSVTSSEDTNLRLLSKPDTVNALQELTRIAVQTKTGGFSRLILDVGGSRETHPRRCPRCRPTSASSCTTSCRSVVSRPPRRVRRGIATPSSPARSFT